MGEWGLAPRPAALIAPVEDLRSGGGAAERTGDRPAAGLDAGAVRTLCSECDKKDRDN
jgi:hypothetical protein